MTPGYSLVQGSLSNFSGPYFLHATAKRSEIETISCQRSSWESQTQYKVKHCREGLALTHFQCKLQLIRSQEYRLRLDREGWNEKLPFCWHNIYRFRTAWLGGELSPALQQKSKMQHIYWSIQASWIDSRGNKLSFKRDFCDQMHQIGSCVQCNFSWRNGCVKGAA